MPAPAVLLSFEQAAQRIGRSPASLRYMVHKGTGPRSALLAGRRVFKASDIDEWVEAAFEKEAS